MTSPALQRAYAANTETPILAFEFEHSAITGGVLRYVQLSTDRVLGGDLYLASSISATLPKKDTDGSQQLVIDVDNVSGLIYSELLKVITSNRTTNEKVKVTLKTFIPSDISAPQSTLELVCVSASINITSAQINAVFAPLYDSYYPRHRYYPSKYLGVRFV